MKADGANRFEVGAICIKILELRNHLNVLYLYSNTGALGFLTAVTQPSPEDLRKEIRKTRELTDKPFGVNISFLPAAAPPDYAAYIKVIIEEGIKVVETAGNNPGKYIKMFKDGGCIVIHKCVNVRHANTAVRYGADIISMDGYECAGHPVRGGVLPF